MNWKSVKLRAERGYMVIFAKVINKSNAIIKKAVLVIEICIQAITAHVTIVYYREDKGLHKQSHKNLETKKYYTGLILAQVGNVSIISKYL